MLSRTRQQRAFAAPLTLDIYSYGAARQKTRQRIRAAASVIDQARALINGPDYTRAQSATRPRRTESPALQSEEKRRSEARRLFDQKVQALDVHTKKGYFG